MDDSVVYNLLEDIFKMIVVRKHVIDSISFSKMTKYNF